MWTDSLPVLQSKRKDGISDLNTGVVYPNPCAGLVSIFPGGTHSGDNDGKLPPPPLYSWVYGLLKDCVSVLSTSIYNHCRTRHMMDILHIYIFSETEKNLITGIETALS